MFQNNNPNLSENVVSRIDFKVLQGMAYLHSINALHRDIKLPNIFINFPNRNLGSTKDKTPTLKSDLENEDFDIKIGDLGFSKFTDN